jgi:hypothetical protein
MELSVTKFLRSLKIRYSVIAFDNIGRPFEITLNCPSENVTGLIGSFGTTLSQRKLGILRHRSGIQNVIAM